MILQFSPNPLETVMIRGQDDLLHLFLDVFGCFRMFLDDGCGCGEWGSFFQSLNCGVESELVKEVEGYYRMTLVV